jgi:metallo-beta-lactamase family protein
MAVQLQFLGATQTVTGSRFLVRVSGRTLLVDCGLFQGLKELRLRNWDAFPVAPATIDAVLLTHAHIDHSGYLPKLVREGFAGPIWCTPATADLLEIMLPDSAHLQQEEAEFANRHGTSKHKPALPLYTIQDALDALKLVRPVPYREPLDLKGPTATFSPVGHLLGSAWIELSNGGRGVIFSGDVGRYDADVTRPPERPGDVHAIVVESTYGDRTHSAEGVEAELGRIVNDTYRRGGIVLIPSFAVGRSQTILFYLRRLEESGAIPRRPVYVDSPMAVDATALYLKYASDPNLKMRLGGGPEECAIRCSETHFVRTRDESKALNRRTDPCVIITANGMATGGRVLHHLRRLLPEKRNTVLLVGYQAAGTRGRSLLEGAESVKMFGEEVPVRARVENISGFSAHGDVDDLVRWLKAAPRPPSTVFLVHGESRAQEAMAARLAAEGPSRVVIPEYRQSFDL